MTIMKIFDKIIGRGITDDSYPIVLDNRTGEEMNVVIIKDSNRDEIHVIFAKKGEKI